MDGSASSSALSPDDMVREAIAWEPQTVVGELINYGIAGMFAAFPEGADILAQTHDAVVVQCFPEQLDTVKTIIRNSFSRVLYEDMVIPVEIKTGSNWGEVEEDKV